MEVARGFAADPDTYNVRLSGLFKFSDRVYQRPDARWLPRVLLETSD